MYLLKILAKIFISSSIFLAFKKLKNCKNTNALNTIVKCLEGVLSSASDG